MVIGDALGEAGITRSGAILQVTAATLESRRNGVVEALRNLLQPNAIDDQDTLPRAQQAVLEIYEALEMVGSPDLRALLDEAYLSRQLDDLIDLATGSTPDGLRALGTASAVIVQRLERFLIITEPLVTPQAPPASVFFAELRLVHARLRGQPIRLSPALSGTVAIARLGRRRRCDVRHSDADAARPRAAPYRACRRNRLPMLLVRRA